MALVGKRDGRNFGYGRQLSYARPQALRDLFGGGEYGTVRAHSDRWQAFVRWCRSEDGPGFNDARQIDRQTLLDYAEHLRHLDERSDLAIDTAQNRLSSVNRTMFALRGDPYVKLPSPSKALGMRRNIFRHAIPKGQDREQVKQTRKELFLTEMDQVGQWKGLVALIEPHYPRGEGGVRPIHRWPCCAYICCRTGSATAIWRWKKRSMRRPSRISSRA